MNVAVTVTLSAEEVRALQVNERTPGELNIWLQKTIHNRLRTEISAAKKKLTAGATVIEVDNAF